MRVESGSHVDSKGWNLGVGWAREDAAKDGTKRLFSPFVEYGRSTYDSYLDNGTHGSGKLSYLGLGVLGKPDMMARIPTMASTSVSAKPSRCRRAPPSTPMCAISGRTRTVWR